MNQEIFSRFITTLRKEKNMTQKELAGKLHVTDKAVSKWETGKCFPDISLLEPLAEELGVSVLELLDGRKRTEEELSRTEANTILEGAIQHSASVLRKRRWSTAILFLMNGAVLGISLKLFYNMGIAADELNTSPVAICGSWFWLSMDWVRLLLLFIACWLGLYLVCHLD